MSLPRVGFIGLGRMGGPMALNVGRAGYPLAVHNRTPERTAPLAAAGARVTGSPREAAAGADVVITMLADTEALRAVVLGPEGALEGLAPGAVLVDMSTVDPRATREIAALVGARGATMLDAPVSGSVTFAREGTLSIMVGGDRAVHDRIQPLLLTMGSRTTHVGPIGAAVSMKLAVNIVIGVTMQVLAESLALAERSGVPRAVAIEVLAASAVGSPFVKYKAPQLLDPHGAVAFTAVLMQKDLGLALALARDLGVPAPATAAANEMLTVARGLGYADHDVAIVTEVVRRLAGAPPDGPSTAG